MEDILAILNDIHPGKDFAKGNDFFAQGVLDSLDLIALVAAIEARYNVFIDVEQIVPDNFKNLSAIKALLARQGVTI
jgi:acyl carrier protein